MKKTILNTVLIAFLITGVISCKEKENEGDETTTSNTKEIVKENAIATDFNVNPEESILTWKGSKPLGSHSGTINISSGRIIIKGSTSAAGKFSFDMTSITSTDLEGEDKQDLEAHLKGALEGKEEDFFNVTKYPFGSFEMTEAEVKDGKALIKGNLTIKEKTNPIEFPVQVIIEEYKVILKSDSFKIDRTQWGINFMSKSIFDS